MELFRKKLIFYIVVLLSAILFLFIGFLIVTRGTSPVIHQGQTNPEIVTARAIEILSFTENEFQVDLNTWVVFINIDLIAEITSRHRRGEQVVISYSATVTQDNTGERIRVGNRIFLIAHPTQGFVFFDFVRLYNIVIIGVVFLVLILVFGRTKGLNAIITLGLTCVAIFFVFIPAILAGYSVLFAVFLLAVYTIVFTLLLVVGANKKSLVAMVGCLGGLIVSGILMLIMSRLAALTGAQDSDLRQLFLFPIPINPVDVIFAGVIIGAVGAIMDVAMSIASAMWEIRIAGNCINFATLFKSGINIGKDIMGTMLNTLILAYIGSSLAMILVSTGDSRSLIQLLNSEIIATEILRALVGSFGMLSTIPLTAAVSAWLFCKD